MKNTNMVIIEHAEFAKQNEKNNKRYEGAVNHHDRT